MRHVIDKMVPLEQAIRFKAGEREYLKMLFERMAEEIIQEQTRLNVTEGEYRLRLELIIGRSSLNPERKP